MNILNPVIIFIDRIFIQLIYVVTHTLIEIRG